MQYMFFGKTLITLNSSVQVSSKQDVLSLKTAIPVCERSIEGFKEASIVTHLEADLYLGFYFTSFGLSACSCFKECWASEHAVLRRDSSRHALRSCQD